MNAIDHLSLDSCDHHLHWVKRDRMLPLFLLLFGTKYFLMSVPGSAKNICRLRMRCTSAVTIFSASP